MRNRGTAPTLEPDNGGLIPASATGGVYPNGVDSKGMTRTGTFDKNADGSINQTAYDARWLKQGGNGTNDTYTGQRGLGHQADVLRQPVGRLVPDEQHDSSGIPRQPDRPQLQQLEQRRGDEPASASRRFRRSSSR